MNSKLSIVLAIALLVVGLMITTIVGNRPQPITEDLNYDGVVDIKDFSIALYLVNSIKNKMEESNQPVPDNVIESVYPDVPPYSPSN